MNRLSFACDGSLRGNVSPVMMMQPRERFRILALLTGCLFGGGLMAQEQKVTVDDWRRSIAAVEATFERDFDAAIEGAKKTLGLARRLARPDRDPSVEQSLRVLVACELKAGRYDTAASHAEEFVAHVVDVGERAGGASVVLLEAVQMLANCQLSGSHWEAAASTLAGLIELRLGVDPIVESELAANHRLLARCFVELEDFASAKRALNLAVFLAEQGDVAPATRREVYVAAEDFCRQRDNRDGAMFFARRVAEVLELEEAWTPPEGKPEFAKEPAELPSPPDYLSPDSVIVSQEMAALDAGLDPVDADAVEHEENGAAWRQRFARIKALLDQGRIDEAVTAMDLLVVELESAASPRDRTEALSNLGGLLSRAERHEDAFAIFERELQTARTLIGPESEEVGLAETNLARCLVRLGKLDEAQARLDNARALFERHAVGGAHRGMFFAVRAALARGRGDLDAARSLTTTAIQLIGRDDVANAEHLLRLHWNLAQLHDLCGDLDSAEVLYLELVEEVPRQLGAKHVLVGETLEEIGHHLRLTGDRSGAMAQFERALRFFQDAFGDTALVTARVRHTIGTILIQEGRATKAIEHLERALQARWHLLGAGHADTGRAANDLGAALLEAGRYEEADSALQQAEDVFAVALPGDDRSKVSLMLSRAKVALRRPGSDAVGFLDEVVAMSKRLDTPQNRQVMIGTCAAAEAARNASAWQLAVRYYAQLEPLLLERGALHDPNARRAIAGLLEHYRQCAHACADHATVVRLAKKIRELES